MSLVEQLRQEVAKKEVEIEALKQALAVLEGQAVPLAERGQSNEYMDMGVIMAAKRWFREVGRPQNTSEIKYALLRRGWKTTSKNPTATIYATLDNSQDFVRTADGHWRFKTEEEETK